MRGSGLVHESDDGSLAVVHGTIRGLEEDDGLPATLLELYRRDPRGLEGLSGSYVLALWDAARRRLVLANDRFGSRNLYLAIAGDVLVFAPLVGALLALPDVARDLDLGAVADLLTFQHVLGDATLLRDVRALPPASIATFDASGLRVRRRWQPVYRPERSARLEEYADELGRRLRAAVVRSASSGLRPGLPLSGGLDSRALLAVLDGGSMEMPCFTYGVAGCLDVLAARRLAASVGAPHRVIELEPGYVARYAGELVRLTDGMHLALNGHATALQQCADWCDLLVLGNGGDSLLDAFWKRHDARPGSEAFVRGMYDLMSCGVDGATARHVLAAPLRDELRRGPLDRLRRRLALYQGETAADVADAYNAGERHWRWVLQGVPAQSTHVEFRQPFFDDGVTELALRAPTALRTGRRLHVELIRRMTPDL
ncbi:MAG: asparagine synthase-related protein, partial [Thermodesulfobacteriota bacterium]